MIHLTDYRGLIAATQPAVAADFLERDFWPASQFCGQMSHPLCRNHCVLSECTLIQTPTAVADI
jgi:hypothetical protein